MPSSAESTAILTSFHSSRQQFALRFLKEFPLTSSRPARAVLQVRGLDSGVQFRAVASWTTCIAHGAETQPPGPIVRTSQREEVSRARLLFTYWVAFGPTVNVWVGVVAEEEENRWIW